MTPNQGLATEWRERKEAPPAMTDEMRNESLEDNLERQKQFFEAARAGLCSVGLNGARECSELSGEVTELVMATIINYLLDACDIPLSKEEAVKAATGPFCVGYWLGMKANKPQRHACADELTARLEKVKKLLGDAVTRVRGDHEHKFEELSRKAVERILDEQLG